MAVDDEVQAEVRSLRSKEQWLRYDSVVIGPGAKEVDPTWFDTWAQFANAEKIRFNGGNRNGNVGLAYSNQQSEREDFAQDIYQSGIEFFSPPGILDLEQDATDALLMPLIFTQELPRRSSFLFQIADTDTIAVAPGIHMPAGVGTSGGATVNPAADVTPSGVQGTPDVRNTWNWPEPIKIPAQAQFTVTMRLDQPWKRCLLQLVNSPKSKVIPIPPPEPGQESPGVIVCENWYVIRVWHRGPRYVQLRGARSA